MLRRKWDKSPENPVVAAERAKMATANSWKDGKITRATDSHADWTRAVATAERVPLVDLNELIAKKYDALGQEAVTALFADKTVHTGWAGAELNALTVVEGLRALDIPAFSVQYHPEAAAGPHDAGYLFDQFVDLMEAGK